MAWLSALTEAELWTLAMIVVASAVYATALLAAGAVLFSLAFADLPDPQRRAASITVVIAACSGQLMILLQWLLQAGYLGGGNLASALDPTLLGIVFSGAPGTRLSMLLSGLVLVLALPLLKHRRPRLGQGLALVGVGLIVLAFTQVGHTTGEQSLLLGALLCLHLLSAAFWVGSLWPLYHLAGNSGNHRLAADILARFGRIAAWAVGALLLAGLTLAALLLGGLSPLLGTAYGQFLLAKLAIVALLLLLAASNKWRLVPAFQHGDSQAPRRLRRSIALEMALVTLILLLTGALTTLSSPSGT